MNWLWNFDIMNLLLKTNMERDRRSNVVILEHFHFWWEVGEVGKWQRWEGGEVRRWQRWEDGEVRRWQRWEDGEVRRWQRWEDGEVVRWEGDSFLVLFKVGDIGWVQKFIFLFLMLIEETKGWDRFKIFLCDCRDGKTLLRSSASC